MQAFRCLEVLGVSGFDWMFMRATGTMQRSPKTLGISGDMMIDGEDFRKCNTT